MRCLLIVLLVLLVAALLVLFLHPSIAGKGTRKAIGLKPGDKIYGDSNKEFLPYPEVDWTQTEQYNDSIARFLFALAWNSTSAKITSQKVPLPPDFDVLVDLRSNFWVSELEETYALFLHSSSKAISVVAFGGTESFLDVISDISYSQILATGLNVSSPNILVHAGFYGAYMDIRPKLKELVSQYQGSLYLTGYSMGGGLNVISALDFADDPDLKMAVSFASPRATNDTGSKYLTNIKYYRIANSEDIVPTLPPPILDAIDDYGGTLYYEHVGENIVFTDNLLSVLNNHSVAYRRYMGF